MSTLQEHTQKMSKLSIPVQFIIKASVAILPVAQIAIGALYLNECPREYRIPIYLVVLGVFSVVTTLLSYLPCTQSADGTTNHLNRVCAAWNALLFSFMLCWFIAGNVWIYRIYQPNYEKNNATIDTYCNKTLYLFAFWSTTLAYILLGGLLVIGCCVLVCMCLCPSANQDVGA